MAAWKSYLYMTFLKRYFAGELVSPFPVNLEQNKKSTSIHKLKNIQVHRIFWKYWFSKTWRSFENYVTIFK